MDAPGQVIRRSTTLNPKELKRTSSRRNENHLSWKKSASRSSRMRKGSSALSNKAKEGPHQIDRNLLNHLR